jgi:hypothetical protein
MECYKASSLCTAQHIQINGCDIPIKSSQSIQQTELNGGGEEKMAIPPCFPKTSFSFALLLVLLVMCMEANRGVKAQAGRLPDDEGTSFSVYVYGFSSS